MWACLRFCLCFAFLDHSAVAVQQYLILNGGGWNSVCYIAYTVWHLRYQVHNQLKIETHNVGLTEWNTVK
jgi:hypothetical protein